MQCTAMWTKNYIQFNTRHAMQLQGVRIFKTVL